MTKFSKEGLRFIIGILIGFLTLVVATSVLVSGFRDLARSVSEISQPGGSTSVDVSKETFRVDFNAMGGTLSGASFLTVDGDKPIVDFPVVTKEGYDFLGWFTGITPNDVLFTSDIPVVQDVTLFARYIEIGQQEPVKPGDETFRVAFESNGGNAIDSIQVKQGGTIELPRVLRDSYVFLGWFTGDLPGDVLFTAQTQVTRDLTLYALWDRESFMITFISNGGSFTQPLIAKADSDIEAPTSPRLLNHKFEGWFLDSALLNAYTFDQMPVRNLTLYAKFSLGTDEGVEYSCSATDCAIVAFDNFHTQLIIPALKNNLPVTSIADFAFKDSNRLSSVVFLGNDLESIGVGAFENASLLSAFSLPESVSVIKTGAFKNASSLTSFDIVSNITAIGQGILEGASSLGSITVPLFGTNPSLQPVNIKYYFGGTTYDSLSSLPISLVKVTITEGILAIPNDAFRDILTIKEVHLPLSITSVGTNVLSGTFVETLTWTFTGTTDGSPNSYLSYAFGDAYRVVTGVPSSLTKVTVNELSSKTILANAFFNIASLENIVLPNTIETISPSAFAHNQTNTSLLKSITLPSNLKSIGTLAFHNSSNLQTLTIPNSVTTLGTKAFEGTLGLKSFTIGGEVQNFLRFYFGGTSATAGGVLPTELAHVKITTTANPEFPASYFQNFSTIKTIELPNTITTFGANTFNGTTELVSVVLPENLISMGVGTFLSSGIESVVIPSKIVDIPIDTFRNARNLKSVTLPDGLLTIGNTSFYDALNLSALTIPKSVITIGNSVLAASNVGNASKIETININLESLPVASRYLRFLFGGTSAAGTVGFLPTQLKTVNLTTTALTEIPAGFFQNFSTVETITLDNTFVTMGNDVFNGTTRLTDVTLPSSLTNLGNNAFLNSSSMLNIELPNTVTTFGDSAFEGTLVLTTIEFPNALSSIGVSVFKNSGLISVEIPTFMTTIPNDTFNGATNLVNVTMHDDITLIGVNAFRGTKIETISLTNNLIEIQARAFQDAQGLKTFTIPTSVSTIGINILTNTLSLETLTFQLDSLPSVAASQNLAYLFGGAVSSGLRPVNLKTVNLNVSETTSLDVPKTGPITVPNSFFHSFVSLETVVLSNVFTAFGTDVFNGTTSLNAVNIPNQLITLPNNTFFNSGLKTFTVPSHIVTVGNGVFQNASRLTSVVIPNTVTAIGTNFVNGATSLETLEFAIDSLPAAAASQNLRYLFGMAATTSVRAPSLKTVTLNSISQTTLPNSVFYNFASIETVNLDDKFEIILNTVFFGTTSLNAIKFPSSLTTLGTGVFQNSGIQSVVIPDAITEIPIDTFNGAIRLTTVTLHSGVTSIGVRAFQGSGITSITLPNSLTTIGLSAFLNAAELTSLTIPSSVTTIGTGILAGTNKLETLSFTLDSLPSAAASQHLGYLFGVASTTGVRPTSLKTVTLNVSSTTSLGVIKTLPLFVPQSFFHGYTSIETVNLDDNFTALSPNVFFNATALKNVKLPNALTIINADAFSGTSVESLILPSTVTTVTSAFRGMSPTAKIYFEGPVPTIAPTTTYVSLFGTNDTIEVYVLSSNLEDFKAIVAFNALDIDGRLNTYTPGA